MNIIRINDTDVYEDDDDVGDKDTDALTTCMQMCAHDIEPGACYITDAHRHTGNTNCIQ